MKTVQGIYEEMGAEFAVPQHKILEKLQFVKAFIFDWDGVFNDGVKQANGSSSFNEIDSMGLNLLRFSSWLRNKKMPYSAIISGEKNETAFFFCKRECLHASYFKVADKKLALQHFCEAHGIKPHEVCYVFDDVLDLPVASVTGLRVFIPRKSTRLLTNYVKQNQYADYITAASSGQYAVRETCEMLMAVLGDYEKVVTLRMNFDESYKEYVALRKDTTTQFFTLSNGAIAKAEL